MPLWRKKRNPAPVPAPVEPDPPPPADLNTDTVRMFAYHERTKHSYVSVYSAPHYLDWDNQPSPFRRYEGAPRVDLPREFAIPDCSTEDILSGMSDTRVAGAPVTREILSSLLYHSMAISAWKQVRGTDLRYSLRVNPSSGNLHPTDTWVCIPPGAEFDAGVYHYDVLRHALEHRRGGDARGALGDAVDTDAARSIRRAQFLVMVTTVFWREAWKYRDRAYRYCLHDSGHAVHALMQAARALGYAGTGIGHFADDVVRDVFGIAGGDEQPLCILAFGDRHDDADTGTAPLDAPRGTPNVLSPDEVPYPLIDGIHLSTYLPAPIAARPRVDASPDPRGDITVDLGEKTPLTASWAETVRRRRSAVDYTPDFSISQGDLSALLAHALHAPRADFLETSGGDRAERPHLVTLYLYVHAVEGVARGCYRYDPERHGLILIKDGDHRGIAKSLSLGQDIAAHAAFAVSMIADLETAARVFGNRGYRYVHAEAGMIGQALYVGAAALGYDATGVGAFYDDDVHRYLNMPPATGQVIYHFTVGKALWDDRLVVVGRDAFDITDDVRA